MSKSEKSKTVLSKIAVGIVVVYYALGVLAMFSRLLGTSMLDAGNMDGFHFWFNKMWDTLSKTVVLLPFIGAIPNIIFNIVGMIKEKRVFPFLLCIFLPVIIWIIVAAYATAYA